MVFGSCTVYRGLEEKHMIRSFISTVQMSRKCMSQQYLCLMDIVTKQAPSWDNKDDITSAGKTHQFAYGTRASLFVVSHFSGIKMYAWELQQEQFNLFHFFLHRLMSNSIALDPAIVKCRSVFSEYRGICAKYFNDIDYMSLTRRHKLY